MHLVDSGAHAALQHHLQHLGVCWVLVCCEGQLLRLLLHVLNGHLNGDKNDLEKKTQQPQLTPPAVRKAPHLKSPRSPRTDLLLVDDVDPRLDVRESVRRREDGFAFVLLVQLAVGSPVQSEGSTVHEVTQVVVLVKIGDSFLQLIRVEERLDVRYLEVCLKRYVHSLGQSHHLSAMTQVRDINITAPCWDPVCSCPLDWSP